MPFLETLLGMARTYGPIARFRLFGRDFYLLDDPELVRDLLVTAGRDVVKSRGAQSLKRLLGEGLLTSEEPLHLRQRRLVQPAFHRERIAGYASTMVAESEASSYAIRDGATIDIMREMMALTLAIAAKTLFGSDVRDEAATIYAALTTAIELVPTTLGPLGAIKARLPLPENFRFRRARRTLDRVIYAMIAARRADPSDRGDLLSTLLLARDEEAHGMRDAQVRDEAMTIFIAGHETTALALTWSWYLLSQDAAAEQRLHAEVDAVLGERSATLDDVPRLPYATAVVKEALRLYPPAWLLGRRTLRDVTLAGRTLRKGSVAFVSPYVSHRNPRWFPQPEAFLPERWETLDDLPKFAYYPFGGGTRVCIGEAFAWTEAVLALATLAQRWRFALVPGTAVALLPMVTIRPKYPLMMTAHRRAA